MGGERSGGVATCPGFQPEAVKSVCDLRPAGGADMKGIKEKKAKKCRLDVRDRETGEGRGGGVMRTWSPSPLT